MKIRYFEVDGFKNIESAHIDLTDITTLMALNSKGKSNLLKGVLFGLLMISNSPDVRNTIYHSSCSLSKPLIDSCSDKEYRFEMCTDTTLENENVVVTYSFTMKWDQKVLTDYYRLNQLENETRVLPLIDFYFDKLLVYYLKNKNIKNVVSIIRTHSRNVSVSSTIRCLKGIVYRFVFSRFSDHRLQTLKQVMNCYR